MGLHDRPSLPMKTCEPHAIDARGRALHATHRISSGLLIVRLGRWRRRTRARDLNEAADVGLGTGHKLME